MQSPTTGADKQDVPGTLHQGILLAFQDDPWLAFDLLGIARPTDGVPIDRRGEIEHHGPEPWTVRPGFPDLVLVHRDASDETRGVVITVEAQKAPDYGKRWMIPVYQSHLAEEHRLETYVVVISLDRRVSRLLRSWTEGGPPRLDILLIDVDSVPTSPWLDDPGQRPMAAVLVGALHGYAGDFDAARIGFHAARSLTKRRHRHGMTVLAALPEHQRNQLIGELPVQEQHDWMDVERRSGTFQIGRREGLEQGLEQARTALRELIFAALEDRQLALDSAGETRIRECDDLPTLQRWARRAMTGPSAVALFEPG